MVEGVAGGADFFRGEGCGGFFGLFFLGWLSRFIFFYLFFLFLAVFGSLRFRELPVAEARQVFGGGPELLELFGGDFDDGDVVIAFGVEALEDFFSLLFGVAGVEAQLGAFLVEFTGFVFHQVLEELAVVVLDGEEGIGLFHFVFPWLVILLLFVLINYNLFVEKC